jgi:hypothetical protein
VLLPNLAHCRTHPPAGPPAAGPLPGRLFQLSTRDGTGRPPALVLLMVVPRRLFAAAAALDCMLLPSERAGCFRAQDGMRSSGFVPCTTEQTTSGQLAAQERLLLLHLALPGLPTITGCCYSEVKEAVAVGAVPFHIYGCCCRLVRRGCCCSCCSPALALWPCLL